MGPRLMIAAALLVGFAAGAVLVRYGPASDGARAQPVKTAVSASVVEASADAYFCPMHPDVVRHEPGNCPVCGMHLVPARLAVAPAHNVEAVVDVDIFRSQMQWMKSGDRAELRLSHIPDKVWRGTVAVEGAQLNLQKRTYVVRLTFPMAEGVAMSNMTGEVRIFGDPKKNVLLVPRDALIRTEHESRVVRTLADGRYDPVIVMPGLESGDQVEIVAGLREGDQVVVSAQFLIDSESNLQAEFARMSGQHQASGASLPAHNHGNHDAPPKPGLATAGSVQRHDGQPMPN